MSVPQVGENLTVEITGVNHQGDGVGRLQGFTLFVPGAVPGDRVRVTVEGVRPSYGIGRLECVEKPSPDRVGPVCPVFGACGGCAWQNLRYDAQLRLKRESAESALKRIGGLELHVHNPVPSPAPFRYRSKGQFPVAQGEGRLLMGCYARGTHQVVDVLDCAIQDEDGNRALMAARAALQDWALPAYDESSRKGLVRHLLSRVGNGTGEIGITVVTSGEAFPGARTFGQELINGVEGLVSIARNINTSAGNEVLGPTTRILAGKERILTRVGGFEFGLSPTSFFQVNVAQAQAVFEKVTSLVESGGVVVDAYCGVGAMSLHLAGAGSRVIGIELSEEAVRDARDNARRNAVESVTFMAGAVETVLPSLGDRPKTIVVDPPRKGCGVATLEALVGASPETLIYVSCNPATLARDMEYLVHQGYEAGDVWLFDMFPQTPHVETVVSMVRIKRNL
ncbi:MAG: 23S rRNA (uracil(1939)-C(5))-methyltransferase RlmD [Bacillota bacterium]